MNNKLRNRSAAALAGAGLIGTLVPLSIDGIVSDADAQEHSSEQVMAEVSGAVTSTALAEAVVALNAAEDDLKTVRASQEASAESLAVAKARLVAAQEAVAASEGDLNDAETLLETAISTRDAAADAEVLATAEAEPVESALVLYASQIDDLDGSLAAVEATIGSLDALPSVADATDLVDWATASRDAAEADWLAADDLVEQRDAELTLAIGTYEDAQAAAPSAGDVARADFRIFRATNGVEAAQKAYDTALAEGSPDVVDRQAELDAAIANLDSEVADRAAMTAASEALPDVLDALRDAEGAYEAAEETANALAEQLSQLNADLTVAEAERDDASTAEADLALAREEAADLADEVAAVTAQLAEAEAALVVLREALTVAAAELASASDEVAAAEAAVVLVGEAGDLAIAALEAEREALGVIAAEHEALVVELLDVENRIGLLRDNLAALEAAIDRTSVAKVVMVGQVLAAIAPLADENPIRVLLLEGTLPDGVEITIDGTFVGEALRVDTTVFVVEIIDSVTDVVEIRTVTVAVAEEVVEKEVVEKETEKEVVEKETEKEVVEKEAPPLETSVLRGATIGDALPSVAPIAEGNAISVSIESGDLPAGIVVGTDGTFVGSLSESGQVTATVLIIDHVTGDREIRTITWEIGQKPAQSTQQEFALEPGQTIPSLSPINVGNAIDAQLLAGDLPAGVALAIDGSFVGAPIGSGSFAADVLVTDTVNYERERRTVTFAVVAPPVVTPDGSAPVDPIEPETTLAPSNPQDDGEDDLDLALSDAPATLAFTDDEATSGLSLADAPDTLAYTGTETTWVFSLAGVGMVIAGAGTLVAGRRRRRFGDFDG